MPAKSKRSCPKCGSVRVVPILYGLPTGEAIEDAEQGKLVLGGCCIDENSPDWHCHDCGHEWQSQPVFGENP